MPPIRVVLADDHPIVLDGLESLFKLESDLRVVARCVNGEETLQAVRQHRPDILILDLNMPRKNGMEVLHDLHRDKSPTRVVLLAATLEDEDVLAALRYGARGLVLKELAPQLLVQCVRKVHAGEQWLEKTLSGRALETLLRREAESSGERRNGLTPREHEITRLVANGASSVEVAERLGISEGTVKIHLHKVYKKLKVQNRVGLVLYAQKHRLV